MLRSLSIRDVVLIDRLDLDFDNGLCVLTGETGAGKSILLDALGLALGARAESGLIRHGSERASVTAAFEAAADHPACEIARDQGLEIEDELILRRVLSSDGRSRAFINDQPVAINLLRRVGDALVEIEGQFAEHGLMDAATHRKTLDLFGGLAKEAAALARAHGHWQEATAAYTKASQEFEQLRADRDLLEADIALLEELAPEEDEEARLLESRGILAHRERLVAALNAAREELNQPRPVDEILRKAESHLARVVDKAGPRLEPALAALDRAAIEAAEALAALETYGGELDAPEMSLEALDDRLHALRAAARRHEVDIGALAALCDDLKGKLARLDDSGTHLLGLQKAAEEARDAYLAGGRALSKKRTAAAAALDRAVMAEFGPLKLGNGIFTTRLTPLDEDEWGPAGLEHISFEIALNPGTPPGALSRIASGGELSRIMLALKVVLANIRNVPVLVFDEVDSGVGGATAAAVGERLSRLSEGFQVLVVTHSPQVAALGRRHWRVAKDGPGARTLTTIFRLDAAGRREEIARMLSGARITDEARAAADRLLDAAAPTGAGDGVTAPASASSS